MTHERKKCVFAGTFDPPTLGHKAVVDDCLQLFDEVVIAVLDNPEKSPKFTLEQRKEMLALNCSSERIKIRDFHGTVAQLLQEENTNIYVRGIRNGVDLDYEDANFYASKKLMPEMITVYLPCRQELLHVSSSMVRSSMRFGTPTQEYLTNEVQAYINQLQTKE